MVSGGRILENSAGRCCWAGHCDWRAYDTDADVVIANMSFQKRCRSSNMGGFWSL